MKRYSYVIFAAALMVAFLASTGLMTRAVEAAVAACTTEVITEDDIVRQAENTPPTNEWVMYTRAAGAGTFRTGPATPPMGVGSLELVTPTGADKAYLFNYEHVGTALSDINQITYSTYQSVANPAEPRQLPGLNIQIDINGGTLNAGEFATLVYEPVYNTSPTGIVNGQWQNWDAYSGGSARWWGTGPVGAHGCGATEPLCTWDQILALFPDATIVGGFGVNQGTGNPGVTASVDALSIGTAAACVVYNFDPYEVATDKEACKNNGWRTLTDAEGNAFKNQGQCVSYVASGGKSGGQK